MTLRFLDSFDHYTTLNKKYDGVSTGTTISSGNGRRGTDALTMTRAGFVFATLQKNFDNQSTWIIGYAWKVTQLPTSSIQITELWDANNNQVRLFVNSDGTLSVKDAFGFVFGTTTNALSANVQYYIEWKTFINDTTGTTAIRVDGDEWLNLSGIATDSQGTGRVNRIFWVWGFGNGTAYFDDLYILDGSGTDDNDFWGDTQVDKVMPTDDGSSLQWTPSTGTIHYTLVDETPPDTSDYVDSSGSGNLDTYIFVSPTSIVVKGIQQNLWSGTTAGTAIIKSEITTSGSQFYSSDLSINTTVKDMTVAWGTNPATNADWTESQINASEFGVYSV